MFNKRGGVVRLLFVVLTSFADMVVWNAPVFADGKIILQEVIDERPMFNHDQCVALANLTAIAFEGREQQGLPIHELVKGTEKAWGRPVDQVSLIFIRIAYRNDVMTTTAASDSGYDFCMNRMKIPAEQNRPK